MKIKITFVSSETWPSFGVMFYYVVSATTDIKRRGVSSGFLLELEYRGQIKLIELMSKVCAIKNRISRIILKLSVFNCGFIKRNTN